MRGFFFGKNNSRGARPCAPTLRFLNVLIVCLLTFSLIFSPLVGYAQTVFGLPTPGAMVPLSPAFAPVLLKGMTIHPENPLEFDFIIDAGTTQFSADEVNPSTKLRIDPERRHPQSAGDVEWIKKESERLVKYFLASMTVPKDDLWVNLSPYESDRIIPEELGKTELGRDMLAQDYILKQLTASLMYPEEELGKKFWDRIYARAQEEFGTSEIPVNTFNKVWILPDTATVYEHEQTVYIVDSRLKVMLDSDYQVAQHAEDSGSSLVTCDPLTELKRDTSHESQSSDMQSDIIREIILPEIEREVNEGKNFAPLRQIYHSLILAKWYKETIKDSLLSQVYVDQNKIAGVDVNDETVKDQIYDQYMAAYKKGVFNYIREDYDRLSDEIIPRKYFSGGLQIAEGDLEIVSAGSPITDSKNSFGAKVKIYETSDGEIQSSPSDSKESDEDSPIAESDAAGSPIKEETAGKMLLDQLTDAIGANKDFGRNYSIDWNHGPLHARHLWEHAVEIAREEGITQRIDWEIMAAAIVFHDIFADQDRKNHPILASVLLERILPQYGFGRLAIEKVQKAVFLHNKRQPGDAEERRQAGLEAQLMYDIDSLDPLGAKGVWRFLDVYLERADPLTDIRYEAKQRFDTLHFKAAKRRAQKGFNILDDAFMQFEQRKGGSDWAGVIHLIRTLRTEDRNPLFIARKAIDKLKKLRPTDDEKKAYSVTINYFRELEKIYGTQESDTDEGPQKTPLPKDEKDVPADIYAGFDHVTLQDERIIKYLEPEVKKLYVVNPFKREGYFIEQYLSSLKAFDLLSEVEAKMGAGRVFAGPFQNRLFRSGGNIYISYSPRLMNMDAKENIYDSLNKKWFNEDEKGIYHIAESLSGYAEDTEKSLDRLERGRWHPEILKEFFEDLKLQMELLEISRKMYGGNPVIRSKRQRKMYDEIFEKVDLEISYLAPKGVILNRISVEAVRNIVSAIKYNLRKFKALIKSGEFYAAQYENISHDDFGPGQTEELEVIRKEDRMLLDLLNKDVEYLQFTYRNDAHVKAIMDYYLGEGRKDIYYRIQEKFLDGRILSGPFAKPAFESNGYIFLSNRPDVIRGLASSPVSFLNVKQRIFKRHLRLLNHHNPAVRIEHAVALGKSKNPAARDPLKERFKKENGDDGEWTVRRHIVEALINLGYPEDIKELLPFRKPRVYYVAIDGLTKLKTKAKDVLTYMLSIDKTETIPNYVERKLINNKIQKELNVIRDDSQASSPVQEKDEDAPNLKKGLAALEKIGRPSSANSSRTVSGRRVVIRRKRQTADPQKEAVAYFEEALRRNEKDAWDNTAVLLTVIQQFKDDPDVAELLKAAGRHRRFADVSYNRMANGGSTDDFDRFQKEKSAFFKVARQIIKMKKPELVAGDSASSPLSSTDDIGGIDMNDIDVDRQGSSVEIQFSPIQFQHMIETGVDGFTPVIVNFVPLPSILPLLGLAPQKEEELEISKK